MPKSIAEIADARRTERRAVTPYNEIGNRRPQSALDKYNGETIEGSAAIANFYQGSSGAASSANARRRANERLKFGLRNIDLDREENQLNRQDNTRLAINNALQRGIYNSGIRVQQEQRVAERADLSGKRIDLSEDELRASVKTSLAGISAASADARNSRKQQEQKALEDWLFSRDQIREEEFSTGTYDDTFEYVNPRSSPARGGGGGTVSRPI